jgi:3-methyladenine DNA glycosylase AlkD
MWTEEKYNNIITDLFNKKNDEYLNFTKTIANSSSPMIGVNIPSLRTISKEISKTNIYSFISFYKGKYFEERMILGLTIAYSNNIEIYERYLEFYSKEIVDWSLCDTVANSLKLIKNNNEHFLPLIQKLLKTKNEFQVRFALIILLSQYMNDEYISFILNTCLNIKSDDYYVNMALSWLLCECFIKYKMKTIPYINRNYLSKFVLNKTISKICDSYRVSSKDKEQLKKERI